ncbi:MAG TPA: ThiF family adenylyltransferase [Bryobacteraceae bacterium]|nr:ThiF family adenylyltransferase [Bryobacteraceae bacterium]
MTPEERERYSRQIRFPAWGEHGQRRLMESCVAIVGCGALGSYQAGSLARAGVGRLILIDRDYVEVSNLQRQWLFDEADVAEALPKAAATAMHIKKINQGVSTEPVIADITATNIDDILSECDLILDGTDNFETRYLLNEFAIARSKPWIYGAAVGSYGITMPVLPGSTSCLVCIYPTPPPGAQPTCETAGVLNPITSVVASLQCADAMKILTGAKLRPRITTVDVWDGSIRQLDSPERDPDCAVCSRRQFPHLDTRRRVPVSLCGRNAVQIHERNRPLDLQELGRSLEPLGPVRVNDFALRFFPSPYEMTIFPDGRAIIKGTEDTGLARSLYARYIGT